MSERLPWHEAAWRMLAAGRRAGRLAHALLICGPAGVGKGGFARALGQAVLCASPDADGGACGHCRPCGLFAAGTHPDVQWVTPVEESKHILVDQVRELREFLQLTSHLGGSKVTVIEPADKLNDAAANSLLKGLEEPPAGCLILLVSDRPGQIPATVRSRCQRVTLAIPTADQALAWLAGQQIAAAQARACLSLAQGAPLHALALARGEGGTDRRALFDGLRGVIEGQADPVALAETWLKSDVGQALYWLYTWLADLIRLRAVPAPPVLINADLRQELLHLAQKMDITALYSRLDQLHEARLALDSPINKQLLVEELLLAWAPREGHGPRGDGTAADGRA